MTERFAADVGAVRRRKLDELFSNQPYLSATMRASRLHERLADDPPSLYIPVVSADADDETFVRLSSGRHETPSLTPLFAVPDLVTESVPASTRSMAPAVTAPVMPDPVALPSSGNGRVHLNVVLDLASGTARLVRAAEGDTDEPDVLTMREAAAYMRVSERTLRSWVRDRQMPCVRIGARLRFRRSAMVEWLAQFERSAF